MSVFNVVIILFCSITHRISNLIAFYQELADDDVAIWKTP